MPCPRTEDPQDQVEDAESQGVFPELLRRLERCHKSHVEEKEDLRRQVCHLSGEVSQLRTLLAASTKLRSSGDRDRGSGKSNWSLRSAEASTHVTWAGNLRGSIESDHSGTGRGSTSLLTPAERWAVLSGYLVWGQTGAFLDDDKVDTAYELLGHWSMLSETRDGDALGVSFGMVTLQAAKRNVCSGKAIRRADASRHLGLGHEVTQLKSKNSFIQALVLSPTSWQRLLWCMIGVVLLTWDALMIPLQVFTLGAFGEVIRTVAIATSTYWVIDVPFQCIVAFQYPDGSEECRPLYITRHYFRTWFPLDLSVLVIDCALFLMDMFLLGQATGESDTSLMQAGRSLRLARLVRLLRLVRLMRLRKLNELMSAAVFRIKSEYVILAMKLAKHVGIIMLINHYIACSWFALADFHEGWSWLSQYADQDTSTGHKYIMALHWSMTQFAPATNNIAPQNSFERVFAVFVVLFALISFSSFISSVTNTVNQLRTLNLGPQMEELRIREFLFGRRVSPDLVGRYLQFFKQNYRWRKKRIREDDIEFFREVPESLKIRMHEETYMPIISESHFFHLFVDLGRPLLVQVCHTAFSELYYLPQQDVFVDGTPASGVYRISSGTLRYCYNKVLTEEMVTSVVNVGDWMAELCLVVKWHHAGQLCATTSTELVKLNQPVFNTIVSRTGGPLVECLRRYAVFILGHIESACTISPITDISMGSQVLNKLAERALRLWQIQSDRGPRMLHSRALFRSRSEVVEEATQSRPAGRVTRRSLRF